MTNEEKLRIIKNWCLSFTIQQNTDGDGDGDGNYVGYILFELFINGGRDNMFETPTFYNYNDALNSCYLLTQTHTIEVVEEILGCVLK